MAVLHRSDVLRFASLFVGRRSDYAVQHESGRYRRVGQPLTFDALRGHLLGTHTLGTYLYNEHGLCREAVFDADSTDGLLLLADVQATLVQHSIPSYLEASRRGGHLHICFSRLVLASEVRSWLLPFYPAGVEFYPKQVEGEQRYGSLMRLPLGIHQRTGQRYPFVSRLPDGSFAPVAPTISACLAWLSTIQRVAVPRSPGNTLDSTWATTLPHAQPSLAKHANTLTSQSPSTHAIHNWCNSQNAVSVIGQYIHLDSRGMGCCPFGEHHKNGRDVHPSFRVYTPRTSSASCWYCYTWQRGGTLFDFLLLWYDLDVKTLWQRIQQGEVF